MGELCHSLRTFFSFFRNLPLPSIRARGLFSITCKKFLQPMAQLAAPSVRGRPRSVQHLFHGGPFSIAQKKKNVCADFRGLLVGRAASALVFSEGFLQAEEK